MIGIFLHLIWVFVFAITVFAVVITFSSLNDPNAPPPVCHVTSAGKTVCQSQMNPIATVLYVYCLFSFFWTVQVIRNVVHVTVCGVFGTFYFLTGTPYLPASGVTSGAMKRAMTTAFGSICFGSLLIAILQLLRSLAQSLRERENEERSPVWAFIASILVCLLSCIESFLDYFTHYAFAHVAIYGKPFLQAGRDTWTMIKDRGVDMLINDDLIGNVLVLGSAVIVLLNAGVACGVLVAMAPAVFGLDGGDRVVWEVLVPVIIGAVVLGAAFMNVVGSVVESGVATTYVALAEDPQVLQRNQPVLFEQIRQTWPRVVQPV